MPQGLAWHHAMQALTQRLTEQAAVLAQQQQAGAGKVRDVVVALEVRGPPCPILFTLPQLPFPVSFQNCLDCASSLPPKLFGSYSTPMCACLSPRSPPNHHDRGHTVNLLHCLCNATSMSPNSLGISYFSHTSPRSACRG